MLEKLRVIFTIPELRKKILITLILLGVYRIGYHITLPVVDQAAIASNASDSGALGGLIQRVSVFSASNLQQATIFGLGIMPYISASIIFQILGSFVAPIQALKKEGQAGMKKINDYTLTKSFGTNNPVTLVKATIEALGKLRTKDEVQRLREVSL